MFNLYSPRSQNFGFFFLFPVYFFFKHVSNYVCVSILGIVGGNLRKRICTTATVSITSVKLFDGSSLQRRLINLNCSVWQLNGQKWSIKLKQTNRGSCKFHGWHSICDINNCILYKYRNKCFDSLQGIQHRRRLFSLLAVVRFH